MKLTSIWNGWSEDGAMLGLNGYEFYMLPLQRDVQQTGVTDPRFALLDCRYQNQTLPT